MNFEQMIKNYAKLIIEKGLNIQKNQKLIINAPIEGAYFARLVAKEAYLKGASEVHLDWNDEELEKIKYLNAPEEVFKKFSKYKADEYENWAKEDAAFLYFHASNPMIFKDIDPNKLSTYSKTKSIALKPYKEYIMNSSVSWCIVSIPTKEWSKIVFPDLTEENAFDNLWKNILKITRSDQENPILAWENHLKNLKEKLNFLNKMNFSKIKFLSESTNLTIKLPKDHIWLGGSEKTKSGIEFLANIPTEEIFSMPIKNGVNGFVRNTKPLNYNGNIIDNFILTFKDGKIIDFSAEQGYDILKNLIETDEGSSYLGEIALVPWHSPISQSNILFYNTLFDENASCHLALGQAYPTCIKNGENLSKEELDSLGVNDSLIHIDFMIGSKDMNVLGITSEGNEFEIFKNGDWNF